MITVATTAVAAAVTTTAGTSSPATTTVVARAEPGDDNGGQPEPGDDHGGETPPVGTPAPAGEASCSVASLVPGALVGEAELRLEGGSAVFEEIELGHHS